MDLHVEQGDLGGAAAVFKPSKGGRIRLMYDPARITERQALDAVRVHLPHLDGVHVVRRQSTV